MNGEKKEKFNAFLGALFVQCTAGDTFIDLGESLASKKSLIVKQRLFRKPIWQPGDPCMVSSLFSSGQCPSYNSDCACKKGTCDFLEKNKAYFELLEKYNQAKQDHETKVNITSEKWKEFIRS